MLNGWPLETYLEHAHPLPTLIREVVAELTGEPTTLISTDGCGTEVFALSLTGMARAFQKLVTAPAGTAEHSVASAMRAHPEMVAGLGRDVTELMGAVPGLLAKDGFEGIQLIALADGAAVALKISDGGDRARMPAAVPALLALGVDAHIAGTVQQPPRPRRRPPGRRPLRAAAALAPPPPGHPPQSPPHGAIRRFRAPKNLPLSPPP